MNHPCAWPFLPRCDCSRHIGLSKLCARISARVPLRHRLALASRGAHASLLSLLLPSRPSDPRGRNEPASPGIVLRQGDRRCSRDEPESARLSRDAVGLSRNAMENREGGWKLWAGIKKAKWITWFFRRFSLRSRSYAPSSSSVCPPRNCSPRRRHAVAQHRLPQRALEQLPPAEEARRMQRPTCHINVATGLFISGCLCGTRCLRSLCRGKRESEGAEGELVTGSLVYPPRLSLAHCKSPAYT
jgi:hypothetical protein